MRILTCVFVLSAVGCGNPAGVPSIKEVTSKQMQRLKDEIKNLREILNSTVNNQKDMQSLVNELTARVAILEGYDYPIKYIDPCGDGPGYDEIIMRTNDGSLIAHFESEDGFLTKLSPGTYRTTDHQECRFTVNGNYEVINETSHLRRKNERPTTY